MTKALELAAGWDAELVSARLRRLAELSQQQSPLTAAVDMSSGAVTARILDCAEISALVWELALAGQR
jgi:hypothetical protein